MRERMEVGGSEMLCERRFVKFVSIEYGVRKLGKVMGLVEIKLDRWIDGLMD